MQNILDEIISKWFIFRAKLQFLFLILNKTKIIQPRINKIILGHVGIYTYKRKGWVTNFFLFLKILKVCKITPNFYRNNTYAVFYGNMQN